MIKEFLQSYATRQFSLPMVFIIIFLVLIGIIVIPNYSEIQAKLGFETKQTLETKLQTSQNNLKQSAQAVKEAGKESDNQQAIGNAKVDSVVDLNQKVNSNNKVTADNKKKRDAAILNLKKSTTLTDVEKDKKIAEVEINSIWDSYCKYNDDTQCKQTPNT